MTSQGYKLTSELDEGLKKYGRDNNVSPTFILNDLVESFLIDKGYLSIKPSIKKDNTPKKIKYAPFDKDGNGNMGYLFEINPDLVRFFLEETLKKNGYLLELDYVQELLAG